MRKLLFSMYKKGFKLFSINKIRNFFPIKAIIVSVKKIWPNFFNFYFDHLHPDSIEIQGHKMFLDSKDYVQLSLRTSYEPFETEIVKKEIKNGEVVLDLGANIGYYTLIFAKIVGKSGKVFAFEPDPTSFSLLKKNVEINGYKNVTLVQKAVSNKTEKARLYLNEENRMDHRIYDSQDGRKCIEIEVIRLDDYFQNFDGKIDFIKFDIQGAEGGALQGMVNLLNKNKNLKLMLEFWPFGFKNFGISAEEVLKLLMNHNFKIFNLNEKKRKVEQIDISKLLKFYTPERRNYTNLLCLRENY